MTTVLFVRRFVADYFRTPVNLLVLVLVPTVFVLVSAGPLADAAELLGGAGGAGAMETITAGWAAGFIAGVAMYFQIASNQAADRRLTTTGVRVRRVVLARFGTGLVLAGIAVATAVAALALRSGIESPGRLVAGTLMYALVYLGIGAAVGALVRNPVNGTVLVMFVWIVDVFFGPVLSASDATGTRVLPTHFVSLWTVDLPSRHGGRLGDLGLALLWVLGALAVGALVVRATIHKKGRPAPPVGSIRGQTGGALSAAMRDWRRSPAFWMLLIVVPAVYVYLSHIITPSGRAPAVVIEDGVRRTLFFDPAEVHSGTMAPAAIASLAMLAGLFIAADTRTADHRVTLAGLRPIALIVARIGLALFASALAAAASLAVAASVFTPRQWPSYAIGNLLIAGTYGLLGLMTAPWFGRVAGVFIAFLVPFVDLGIGQSPMLGDEPAPWAGYLPGYGGMRVMIDGALTPTFDSTAPAATAIGWLIALLIAAGLLYARTLRTQLGPAS